MEPQVFELLMKRFDTLEKLGNDIIAQHRLHVEEDTKVHNTVERHSIYWSIALLGIPTAVGYAAKKFGWM